MEEASSLQERKFASNKARKERLLFGAAADQEILVLNLWFHQHSRRRRETGSIVSFFFYFFWVAVSDQRDRAWRRGTGTHIARCLFARDQSKNKRERKNKKSDGRHLRQISEDYKIIIKSFTTISGAFFFSTLFSLVFFFGTHMFS